MKKFLAKTCHDGSAPALLLLLVLLVACQRESPNKPSISEFVCHSISSDIVIDAKGQSIAIFFDEQSDALAQASLLALNDSIMIGFDATDEGESLMLIGHLKEVPAESVNVGGRPGAPKRPFVLHGWKLKTPYREYAKEDGEIDRELVIRSELKPSDFTDSKYFDIMRFDKGGKFYWCGELDVNSDR